jgi:hypothetical protein
LHGESHLGTGKARDEQALTSDGFQFLVFPKVVRDRRRADWRELRRYRILGTQNIRCPNAEKQREKQYA